MRLSLPSFLLAVAATPALAQAPAGPEFRVNAYTTNTQTSARAAVDPAGRITITWTSLAQFTPSFSVYAQRYAADGTPAGSEFLLPDTPSTGEGLSDVAYGRTGNSVMVWHGDGTAGFDIHARRYARDGTALGGNFRVNSDTSRNQYRPKVASLPGGGFVVAWSAHAYPGTFNRVVTRRFDAFGFPLGSDAQASENPTAVFTNFPSIASSADNGAYVVVWKENSVTSPGFAGIAGRLYDSAGVPMGPRFVVEATPATGDSWPQAAMAGDGSFVVVWEAANDGSSYGIRGRRFSPAGAPVGADFMANQATTGGQRFPQVGANTLGDFVVSWSSRPSAAPYSVVARRFTAAGVPRGGDFAINAGLTGGEFVDDVASDEVGNFIVSWTGQSDGSGYGVFARRFGGLLPAALAVDPAFSPLSDGNGVLEPGETVAVRPSWRNVNGAAQTFTGTMPSFLGPAGATYAVADGAGSYGTVPAGATAPCTDCYSVSVAAPSRPLQHWDAFAEEDIAPDLQGQRKQWRLHVGDSFVDVPRASSYYPFVETLIHHFVTVGCTATQYCPLTPTTREQMAVFVVVARDAAGDPPPDCGTPLFNDVPASSGYCRWIEELARSGVVTGCGGGNFCPSEAINREQMAVFALRTFDPALVPPSCGAPRFADVPASSPYCPWIEELARRGVVTGCGGGNYCPAGTVTREQMAVFISATFGLRLYGP